MGNPKRKHLLGRCFRFGAGDGARTRYLHLGKVALYQMSYARVDVQTQRTCAVLRTLRYALAAHVCIAELHKVGASGRN